MPAELHVDHQEEGRCPRIADGIVAYLGIGVGRLSVHRPRDLLWRPLDRVDVPVVRLYVALAAAGRVVLVLGGPGGVDGVVDEAVGIQPLDDVDLSAVRPFGRGLLGHHPYRRPRAFLRFELAADLDLSIFHGEMTMGRDSAGEDAALVCGEIVVLHAVGVELPALDCNEVGPFGHVSVPVGSSRSYARPELVVQLVALEVLGELELPHDRRSRRTAGFLGRWFCRETRRSACQGCDCNTLC